MTFLTQKSYLTLYTQAVSDEIRITTSLTQKFDASCYLFSRTKVVCMENRSVKPNLYNV